MSEAKMNREQRRKLKKEYRKKMKEQNVSWSEAEEIYQKGLEGINACNPIYALIDDCYDSLTSNDKDYASQTKEQLIKDVAMLSEELNTIHQEHAGKTGTCGIDDIMQFFTVAQAYETWLSRFRMIVDPAIDSLIDIAERGAANKQKEEAEDIVDAEVTEITKEDNQDGKPTE